uniref:CW-type domain-containing protein n=1 Tax=Grammatophora oceanica TaxID=210454 RepID=A0A7S1YBM6_9STRA|mmetsp:Transcript_38049/g.56603  ORF Transcript_38049/g.56603 Transcript_38049/m.56603 type:complete len:455 (+) Transcript_38049:104-1468(+)|eukprot:CAMPEP_0194033788 /NCGR_PEP_ID=MMETSP0009_2-20130614/6326_1 /TAXON_ID=210454 /ORGANISM="Grammatophora oceanica, Strain CCMP 410" /LENGTH=454 /DNA_ID=CAMNT_0038674513 /DNA_START=99 /DNA_END=1463 /DNA_ORIENTATION=+
MKDGDGDEKMTGSDGAAGSGAGGAGGGTSSPPSSPTNQEASATAAAPKPSKKPRKKRKGEDGSGSGSTNKAGKTTTKRKKKPDGSGGGQKKPRKHPRHRLPTQANHAAAADPFNAQQQMVNEQMRRALEEDQYSALGSIVDTESSDEDEAHQYPARRGGTVRLDRASVVLAMRKRLFRMAHSGKDNVVIPPFEEDFTKKKKQKERAAEAAAASPTASAKSTPRSKEEVTSAPSASAPAAAPAQPNQDNSSGMLDGDLNDDIMGRDEGSIFGQTTGSSNSTWVECDKCKKWRRLRGVVDEKKLPSKWYCSMNKNDPERARCSAPEEEYETPNTPESAADARTRKHLRVWVRRLESQETFEGRQPTMTRGKKRSTATTSKDPYEWVRCCNPSCGKWRALLRFMDAKQHVLERARNGEWYCVMNTWDEKMASCAAPQENLPSVNAPPWVIQEQVKAS